jgi:hypothetical protein
MKNKFQSQIVSWITEGKSEMGAKPGNARIQFCTRTPIAPFSTENVAIGQASLPADGVN